MKYKKGDIIGVIELGDYYYILDVNNYVEKYLMLNLTETISRPFDGYYVDTDIFMILVTDILREDNEN
jgi:hypothetical protein